MPESGALDTARSKLDHPASVGVRGCPLVQVSPINVRRRTPAYAGGLRLRSLIFRMSRQRASTFSTMIKARRSGAQRVAARADSSRLRPVVSARAVLATNERSWSERKQMPPVGVPWGRSNRAGCGLFGGGGSTRIIPSPVAQWAVRRRPTRQDEEHVLTGRPAVGRTRICRPRGQSEQPHSLGFGQAGTTGGSSV